MKASLCFLLIGCLLGLSEARNATAAERLYADLLNGYQLARPIINPNVPIDVDVGFSLYQVKSLDGKAEVLETSGCIILVWVDPRLTWNPSDYDDIMYLTIETLKIWVPIVGLKNSVTKVVDPNWRQVYPALVFYDGNVQWTPCGEFASSCSLDMFYFPYDTQLCALDFGNIVEPAEMMNISTDQVEIDTQSFYASSEFTVEASHIDYVSFETAGPRINYTTVEIRYWLTLQRKPLFYIMNITIPAIVLAILSAMTFMVPIDSGERIGLGVSILLAFSVFMLILADNTPQTSQNPAILAMYLTITVTICGLNLLMQIMLLKMHHVTPIRPVPRWMKITKDILSCRFCCRRGEVDPNHDSKVPEAEAGATVVNDVESNDFDLDTALLREIKILSKKVISDDEENAMAEEWKDIAKRIDTWFFYVFIVFQVVMAIICFGILPATQGSVDNIET